MMLVKDIILNIIAYVTGYHTLISFMISYVYIVWYWIWYQIWYHDQCFTALRELSHPQQRRQQQQPLFVTSSSLLPLSCSHWYAYAWSSQPLLWTSSKGGPCCPLGLPTSRCSTCRACCCCPCCHRWAQTCWNSLGWAQTCWSTLASYIRSYLQDIIYENIISFYSSDIIDYIVYDIMHCLVKLQKFCKLSYMISYYSY